MKPILVKINPDEKQQQKNDDVTFLLTIDNKDCPFSLVADVDINQLIKILRIIKEKTNEFDKLQELLWYHDIEEYPENQKGSDK